MRFIVGCFLSLALMVSQASADIMLSTTSGLTFGQNSGVQSFQVFALGAAGDASINALIATVTINSGTAGVGVFTSPISFTSNFNAANVNASSSGALDPIDPRISYLSLDYTADQALPTVNPGVVGTFSFNVNGLTVGNYQILITDTGVGSSGIAPNISATNGSFSITAVPEPSSLLLLGGVGLVGVCYARRRRVSEVSCDSTAA